MTWRLRRFVRRALVKLFDMRPHDWVGDVEETEDVYRRFNRGLVDVYGFRTCRVCGPCQALVATSAELLKAARADLRAIISEDLADGLNAIPCFARSWQRRLYTWGNS